MGWAGAKGSFQRQGPSLMGLPEMVGSTAQAGGVGNRGRCRGG